ncbi:DUF5709 domain-containing protein [Streptomyces sp. NBC_00588]|uniref:DUF5709 domain-containing protein n=1 Tax=Streptomyces sp. NBC_00588 TaxID=2975784 RepID=UPI002E8225A2|nr:DUF5709 domain-containing protein [Streptomyces sp. NBC_00588]WUB41098.1 DUF5709 domain-containing protein [Streptomyces sp. NBC_00588]
MTAADDASASSDPADFNPLSPEEEYDEDEFGEDILDGGYSPPERPLGVSEWGLTAREGASHEDLTHRLRREVPELSAQDEGDGLGDSVDTDGELLDDQVGDEGAGRLVDWDTDGDVGFDDDYTARDVGIDGGAASAEEAAIHVVPDRDIE